MVGLTTAVTAPSTVTPPAEATLSRTTSSTARAQTRPPSTAVWRTSPRTTTSTGWDTRTTGSRPWSSSGMAAAVKASTPSTSITTSTSLTTLRTSGSTVPSPYLTTTPSSVTTSTSAGMPRMSSRECFRRTTWPSLIFPQWEVRETCGRIQSLLPHQLTTISWRRTPQLCK